MADADATSCGCKVGRAVDGWALHDLDDELERRRTDGASLRALADVVNRRILAAAIDEQVEDRPSDGVFGAVAGQRAIETVYEALADDAEPERRARVETRLEQRGLDLESVRADWVTHPTVRHHLRECRGIETSRDASISDEDAVDTLEWARARSVGVVERTFDRLDAAGAVRTGDLDVTVTVQLTCTDCGRTYRPRRLLEAGGCACETVDGTGP